MKDETTAIENAIGQLLGSAIIDHVNHIRLRHILGKLYHSNRIRCNDCRHWGFYIENNDWGECDLENAEKIADIMPDTHKDFGCILGEK